MMKQAAEPRQHERERGRFSRLRGEPADARPDVPLFLERAHPAPPHTTGPPAGVLLNQTGINVFHTITYRHIVRLC
jgi:hypothetical protein